MSGARNRPMVISSSRARSAGETKLVWAPFPRIVYRTVRAGAALAEPTDQRVIARLGGPDLNLGVYHHRAPYRPARRRSPRRTPRHGGGRRSASARTGHNDGRYDRVAEARVADRSEDSLAGPAPPSVADYE